jgi:hypothetical protein
MEIHASHIDYLRAKMLWDHLQDLSVASSDVSQVGYPSLHKVSSSGSENFYRKFLMG